MNLFSSQPEEILKNIFSYCSLETLLKTNIVCKKFKNIISSLIIPVFLKENPYCIEANIDLIKQQRRIRLLVLDNLNHSSCKISKISFKRIFKKDFKLTNHFIILNKLYISVLNKIDIIDLETGQRKKIKYSVPKDNCFLAKEACNQHPHKNEEPHPIPYEIDMLMGQTTLFDPQRPGIVFVSKEQVIFRDLNFTILYKESRIEIIDIKSNTVLFNRSFPGLNKSRLNQNLLLIMNEKELVGIDTENKKIIFSCKEFDIEELEIIDEKHFLINKSNKMEIFDCKTGEILHTLPDFLCFEPDCFNHYKQRYDFNFQDVANQQNQTFFTAGCGKFVLFNKEDDRCFFLINAMHGQIERKFEMNTKEFSCKIVANRLIVLSDIGAIRLDIYDLETGLPINSHQFAPEIFVRLKFDGLNPLVIGKFEDIENNMNIFILDLISGKKYDLLPKFKKLGSNSIFMANNNYFIEGSWKKDVSKKILGSRYKLTAEIKIHHLSKKYT